MDFIFVSLQRINTDRDSTSTCLARELAKNHRVLYVNSPIDRKTYISRKSDIYTLAHIQAVKNREERLSQTGNNFWVLNPSRIIESINWIPLTTIFSFFNRLNNLRLAKEIREVTEQLGFRNYIIINDKDIFRSFYLKEFLKPAKYIYLDRDYTVGMDYWRRHGVSLEPKLMKKSDAIVCNSYDFTNRAKQFNPKSFYIGNGFDIEQYNQNIKHTIPSDLQNIQGPTIGYVGALITLRLNLKLMIEMAKARLDWNFVLIGWEDEDFEKSELHKLSNVFFLGKKHTKEVPAYIQHFDVCINPQILNEITRGNFPLKVVEYLALGKPVVATSTNTMEEVFSQHTYLAEDLDTFLEKIEVALREDNTLKQQERLKFASSFTWHKVSKLLLKAISETN